MRINVNLHLELDIDALREALGFTPNATLEEVFAEWLGDTADNLSGLSSDPVHLRHTITDWSQA